MQDLMTSPSQETNDSTSFIRGLDRKIEFGLPDLEGRTHIFKIHAKMPGFQ